MHSDTHEYREASKACPLLGVVELTVNVSHKSSLYSSNLRNISRVWTPMYTKWQVNIGEVAAIHILLWGSLLVSRHAPFYNTGFWFFRLRSYQQIISLLIGLFFQWCRWSRALFQTGFGSSAKAAFKKEFCRFLYQIRHMKIVVLVLIEDLAWK